MRIEIVSVERGSCNECSQGRIREDKKGLVYPYKKVYQILVGMTSIRLCKDCFVELKQMLSQKKKIEKIEW